MPTEYRVEVFRADGYWILEIPELRGGGSGPRPGEGGGDCDGGGGVAGADGGSATG